MITHARAVRVFVHRTAVDMRKSFDTLAALVVSAMQRDPYGAGTMYVFVGRDRRRCKVLWFDGTGVCVLAKRLSRGHFPAPWQLPEGAPLELTASELSLLLEGSEIVGRVPLSPAAMDLTKEVFGHTEKFSRV